MPARIDPRITAIVDLLPADGSGMTHSAWRAAIVASGNLGNLRLLRAAQQQGFVTLEIVNPDEPADSLTVKRVLNAPTA